ncbi:FUSC family protein [Streptomyces diastaticus]|uniref:FUSC family protein n=1 Tax=Streptomyces diastaticus TaxID=1956 RepID=UPI0035D53B76
MFVAPDPGLLRLRGAGRAVLGIGLAATVSGTAGQSLTMAVAGGLAALLALFTVADPTVRGQALTTALLPAAGCPVLALAVLLHDRPLPRDLAFLAVVGLGVYARRWGPRGNALGIFAFMCFFLAQFLHAVPAQLPGLYAAVALALLTSSAVRFGLWCYERRLPAPRPAPAPLGGRRLRRPTTRQAVQATVAGGLALAAGQALSHERWYWAVGTVWWIFVNTASRGETLVRGFRRVLGTAAGVVAGLGVAVPLHGEPAAAAVLVALCVAGIFYVAAVSYSWMIFFVTVLVGVLYGTLGTVDSGLLALRLLETLAGAAGAALAVLLVLPVTTHATTEAWIRRTLHCVHLCAVEAAGRLAGSPTADPAGRVAELEVLLGRVRLSVAPLVHPLSPLGHRRTRARRVLALLDACGREARGLASVAAGPEGSRTERLTVACARVEAAVRALTVNGTTGTGPPRHPARPAADEPALAHLHGLERALAELAEPLRGRTRRPALAAR